MPTYITTSADARHAAMIRPVCEDPVTYDVPTIKRFDARHQHVPIHNEVVARAERGLIADVCRVKNNTGGALVKGDLVYCPDLALSAQTTAVASNNPTAGTTVVINVAATFEVGQLVTIVSGGITEYALVTAIVAATSVTVDKLNYDHTAPTVTALPSQEIALADADDPTKTAQLVLGENISNGSYGWAYGEIELTGLDTSGFTAEELLYLTATATSTNTLTGTSPTGQDVLAQEVAQVKAVHASTGKIHFYPGRRRIVKIGDNFLQSDSDISLAGPKATWYKFTVTYADIATAVVSNSYTFATLPIKGKVHETFVKHSAAFTGGGAGSCTVSLGIASNTTKYSAPFNIFQAAGDTVYDEGAVTPSSLESWTGTTALKAEFISDVNLNLLTAGSVEIHVLVSVLP